MDEAPQTDDVIDFSKAEKPNDTDDATKESDDQAIKRLSALTPIEYERVRAEEAAKLGIRAAMLDRLIKGSQKADESTNTMQIESVDAWPDSINPDALLTEVSDCIKRFIVCPPETATAATLWIAMTHFIEVIHVAPLAVITAPEKRCGKSQLLTLIGKLADKPLVASNISPAALFRSIEKWGPTLLIDEADAFMKDNEELRGIINCGHTRDSAFIIRTVGDNHEPTIFNVWGAKAISGIGHLPGTIMDRAVILELRRKLPGENVSRLRHATDSLFKTLAAKLVRFSNDYSDKVKAARPHLPPQLNDRAQDNWEPLLAIAQVAGGRWPELAKRAAIQLSETETSPSVGVELLSDIEEIFEIQLIDKIFTCDLIASLCADDEKSWSTYNRGKPISPRQVSTRLNGYGIKSKDIRIGCDHKKGYYKAQFEEAFSRYVHGNSVTLADPPFSSVTTRHSTNDAAYSVTDRKPVARHPDLSATTRQVENVTDNQNVTDKTRQHGYENLSATPQATNGAGCHVVTDKTPPQSNEAYDEMEFF
ncbi:DUF3631 domain-containing protein [Methylicorpusculum oleiharenae]|uniref:DUF3631 domain-containing protein n=1 Tax=Methylicorpusculum oleiharenae TaxID=1338687 RepID=UPI00135ADBB5|nr:DUF3631 domain-containing protein [Methylicorpusculum oleiharenae]MCD2449723.1 DUF3631 domain-containing protein [Methylicorpusculum oleiharenae]